MATLACRLAVSPAGNIVLAWRPEWNMSGTRIGLVRCEHCGRQFNPHSAARHIPWCAKQQSDSRRRKPSPEKRQALERYRWRIGYKPSNAFYQNGRGPQSGAAHSNNSSSNFSSSLSASSTNSAGSNCIANGSLQAGRQPSRGQPVSSRAHQVPSSKLKRSISSLTMTKQVGAASKSAQADQLSASSSASSNLVRARAKSQADLQQLELVESLARRMEQIYAQNQLLLAKLAPSKPGAQAACDDDERPLCHHCKSSCLAAANYCHNCGCKLCSSPSSG